MAVLASGRRGPRASRSGLRVSLLSLFVSMAWGGTWSFLDAKLEPPSASFPGSFDRAPVFHFRIPLPGPPLNTASHAEWSNPLIHGDRIFVGSAAGEGLYALSRREGRVLQFFPAGASVEATALVDGQRLFFSDTGGNSFCYTLEGELLWKHDGNAPILVSPTLSEDKTRVIITNVDDLAVSLDTETGALLWQYRAKRDLTRQAELSLFAAPKAIIHDDEVILGFSNGSLVAVELETGEERWKRGVGEGRYPDLVADPVTSGTDLFTSGYFQPLVALDLPSHNIRWRVEAGAAHPVVLSGDGDDAHTIFHPGTDGRLRAIAALTGAELWSWDSNTSGALTTPIITEAGLVVASSEGSIYLIDPSNGEELWRWHEPWILRGISSVPAVQGRQLIFLSNAGYLYSMLVPQEEAEREAPWP